ncbi:hypothetical protein EVAR_41659_1 [Eumeta japonica]|uniref:Uncharacterized protein n=1 Tax=Eumeta variegata TaxID=151549 RepID=A0A4C1VQW0_EUMVA|nr:hypothetical protein EVAR_41659_1 [Eumeta japonica]
MSFSTDVSLNIYTPQPLNAWACIKPRALAVLPHSAHSSEGIDYNEGSKFKINRKIYTEQTNNYHGRVVVLRSIWLQHKNRPGWSIFYTTPSTHDLPEFLYSELRDLESETVNGHRHCDDNIRDIWLGCALRGTEREI